MNVFKIILGIIIVALGIGMAVAGWALATHGEWSLAVNLFLGFIFGFMGLGLGWAGLSLIRGSTVRDSLGGVVTALQGHGGIGLHKDDTYYLPSHNVKDLLLDILKYAIIAICVILIAIFSIFRVIGGFPGGGN